MIIPQQLACSSEFATALKALADGRDVRRVSWREGVVVRSGADGQFYMFIGLSETPSKNWGPSEDDATATDWSII